MNLLKNIQRLGILGALIMLSSCSKWLDVQPATELKQEELFSTQQGFYEAMTGAYVAMTSEATYGTQLTFGMLSIMASDYSVSSSSEQTILELRAVENYDYEKSQVKTLINRIWLRQYNTIAQVNAVLNHIDAKKHLFKGNDFNIIKGEALALRAYIHFDLMRLFAPAYLVKDDKKYMPYVSNYGREVTPFSTVDELVKKMLDDLNEAEALMKDDKVGVFGGPDRTLRMNIYAVKGLLARVYLYMGNKTEAFNKAKEVIDAKKIRLMAGGTDMSLDRSFHTEHLFSLYSDKLEGWVYTQLTPTGPVTTSTPNYYTEPSKLGSIYGNQSTDVRYKAPMMQVYRSNLTPHKFFYQDLPAATPNMRKNYIPLMRISELYYIAAEAAPDTKTAIDYLNLVFASRGILALPQNADVMAEVKKEYRKEFFAEGQFFYFYKRLNASKIDDSPVLNMTAQQYIFPIPEDEKIYGGR